jgi:hypothetical protein
MSFCVLQGPEHCHISFFNKLAGYTDNKDAFPTVLRWHVREGHIPAQFAG